MKIFGTVASMSEFVKLKLSSDETNSDYYFWPDKTKTFDASKENIGLNFGEPQVRWEQIVFIENEGAIYAKGKIYGACDLSNLITREEFSPTEERANNAIIQGTLGTINGMSIEDGNIELNTDLFIIVTGDDLPTENIDSDKIYIKPTPDTEDSTKTLFIQYIYKDNKWEYLGPYEAKITLTDYLKTVDADKRYMKLSNGAVNISVSDKNGLANYSNNGQAFNAIRDCGTGSLTGKALNAGAFGVKLDGTTAFTHKTYDSFNAATGAAGGARNTAVLTFSGATGLRYAKNTGTAADVTDAMYKYVGVIDSPDENQKVYSAAQVDTLISKIKTVLTSLGATDEQIQSIKI